MSRFLLLLGQPDFTWDVDAQMTDGTLIGLSNTHTIQFDGTLFGDKVFLGFYPDSTHVLDQSAVHACAAGPHVNNSKFLTNTTYSSNGGGSANLPISTVNCPLVFTFNITSSVTTNGARFFAYDGSVDATPCPNTLFKAVEGGVGSTWISANGLLNALSLADQTTATSHSWYIACSFSPTTLGQKVGKVKLAFSYV